MATVLTPLLDADLSNTVQLNLDHLAVQSNSDDSLRESGLAVASDASTIVSPSYRYSRLDYDAFDVVGHEPALALALNSLWQSDLQTVIHAGYSNFNYTPSARRTNIANPQGLTQNQTTLGFSQHLTPTLAIHAAHDQFRYDRNVTDLARLLIRRTRNSTNATLTLLGFPNTTRTAGINWMPTENLKLDFTLSKTTTLLDQRLFNFRLGAEYQINARVNFIAAVSKSRSTEILRTNGTTAQAATQDTYTELGAGWQF